MHSLFHGQNQYLLTKTMIISTTTKRHRYKILKHILFFLINQQLIELSRFQYAMLLIATDLELSMKGSNHIDGQVIMGRQ